MPILQRSAPPTFPRSRRDIAAATIGLLFAALFGVGLAPMQAAAQETEPPDRRTEQAQALFAAGRAAFEQNQYEDALRHFREAYELSRRPALLYNIAVAADRLRRDDEALEAFEQYLQEADEDAPQRGDAAARAAVLRQQREQRARTAGPSSASPGDGSVAAGWGIFAGGAAALVAGAVFLGVGQMEADAYESAAEGTPWVDVAGARENAGWMRPTGWALAGLGLAAAVGGLVLALTAPGSSETASLQLRPDGLAFVWRHR